MRQPLIIAFSLYGLMALGAPAQAAMVENLTYDLGGFKVLIPKVETSGGSLTDTDLRAILDPLDGATLAQRLARANAGTVSIPRLSFEFAPGQSFSYRDIKLVNLANGQIEAASAAGASADLPDQHGGTLSASYGAMSMRKVNLGLMLRIATSVRSDPNEPLASLYEDFTADGFEMKSPDADVSMGRISGSGIKGRPFSVPLSEIVGMAQRNPNAPLSDEDGRKLGMLITDMMQSFEVGQVEARDMLVRVKTGEKGEVGIGRFYMGGVSKGRFGELAYEDFRILMPDGKARIGRFALRDLDLSRTFAAMRELARQGDFKSAENDPRALIPTLGLIELTGLDFDVPDTTGKGNSADGKRVLFTLGRFEIGTRGFIEGIPTALNVRVQDFVFPLPGKSKDDDLQQLIAFGLNRLELSHNMDLAWTEATQELGLKDYSIRLPGLGALKITGTIGNLSKELFSSNLALAQATALGALVKSLDINFENLGGVEKGLALQAKQSGQSVQDVKQMLVAGAAVGIPAMMGNSSASKAIGNAVAKFLADPKTLRISARSRDGLGASDLMMLSDPLALLDKVEISASANE